MSITTFTPVSREDSVWVAEEDATWLGARSVTTLYTGPARSPYRTELGWKEMVRMNPEEVTTVIMKFDLPTVPFTVPSSPRTGGNEYVWHCHILEHEEHDMMRPLVVR
jgi:spore coat protein A